MALVRWAPFDLASEGFDDIVRRTFGDFGQSLLAKSAWAPPLDAFVAGEELHVRLEVPGIDPDRDIDIEVTNGMLRISGERTHEVKSEGTSWVRREMRQGRFERAVALPDGISTDDVRANYDAGVLDIVVPLPAKQSKKVKVEVGAKQLSE